MKKFLLIVLFGAFTFGQTFAQSKTVADFEADAKGYKLFLYQSVLRILNKDKNPDFNMLIRDLDHMRIATTDSVGEAAMDIFQKLDQGVKTEGFEEVITFDNKDQICHVYLWESGKGKTSWVATFFMNGTAGVFEMKGSLNLKYLDALASLNTSKMQDLISFD